MYTLEYDQDWEKYFETLPPDIQKRFLKRVPKYKTFPILGFRHEKYGLQFFVDEIGQYRVCFTSDETSKIRRFYFIGDHKNYDKFLRTGK
jgi:mRNA-degrading endonuclease RelE of RelBE toxin-antitoxin system